jgi:hypothetical protein
MSPRALAASVPKVTKAVLQKRGRAYAALIAEWANVVGPALAAESLPERLAPPGAGGAGGTLTIRVAGAGATEIQHLAPQIIERINTFLGFRAVAQLRLLQAPLPGRAAPRRPRPRALSRREEQAVLAAVADVAEPALQAALGRLGRALAADSPPEPPDGQGSNRPSRP